MTKHNIWSISIISFLFVLLFTPLLVTESLYFPYVTGKVFAFRAIMTFTIVAWLILVLKKPEYLPKKSGIIISSGLLIASLAVSNFFGVDREYSFFSNFERMEGWFTHLYLFAYLIIISSVFKEEKIWNWFFGTALFVGNVLGLYVLFDSVSRTNIFLGNSTYVAIYAFFNLFFALLLLYRRIKSKTEDYAVKYSIYAYFALSIMLQVYVIFRTETRGTLLALAFSMFIFPVLSVFSFRKNKAVRLVSVSLFVLALVAGGLFWANRDSDFVKNNPSLLRVATISPYEGTAQARLINWGIAFEGIKERPLLGWGQENYVYVFQKHYDPQMHAQEPWFDRTHNAFIDWAVHGGIVAFLLYIMFFALAVLAVFRSSSLTRTEKNLLVTLLGGYAIHNMFVFDNYSSYLLFFSILGFVVHHSQKEQVSIDWDEKTRQFIVIMLIFITLIMSYFVVLKPYRVSKDLINVLTYTDAYKILEKYEDMLSRRSFGDFEVTNRLLSDAASMVQVKDPQFVKTYLEFAAAAGEDMIMERSNNVRALEFFGTFLLQQGMTQRSVEVLESARQFAPNRHNNLYILGFAYINNDQLDKAEEVFYHAYAVKPDVQKSKNYYGAVLLMRGNNDAWKFLEGYNYKDAFFLNVFNRTKNYKESIAVLEKQIVDQPTNYQLYVNLSTAYLFDGQRSKSIEILKKVIVAVPEFKSQGEFMIKEILAGRNPAL